jgi:hypothetical protein
MWQALLQALGQFRRALLQLLKKAGLTCAWIDIHDELTDFQPKTDRSFGRFYGSADVPQPPLTLARRAIDQYRVWEFVFFGVISGQKPS